MAQLSYGAKLGSRPPSRRLECLTLCLPPLLLLLARLCPTTASHQSGEREDLQSRTLHFRRGRQATGCDLLFELNDGLAKHCECRDSDLQQRDFEQPVGAGEAGQAVSTMEQVAQINQLSCSAQNLAQFFADLSHWSHSNEPLLSGPDGAENNNNHNHSAQDQKSASGERKPASFQIDYLAINANLSQASGASGGSSASSPHSQPPPGIDHRAPSGPAVQSERNQLLIDHISLQLALVNPSGQLALANLEQQMIDFAGLINETHLQFLSIFLDAPNGRQVEETPQQRAAAGSAWASPQDNNLEQQPREISFARLLARLTGLTRLELSLGRASATSLLLGGDTFGPAHKGRLKWLSLASNRQVRFPVDTTRAEEPRGGTNRSPFIYTPSLEYLSLESSGLESFQLLEMFANPLEQTIPPLAGQLQGLKQLQLQGLANLTSLNLAANKLVSIERDLFAGASAAEGGRGGGGGENKGEKLVSISADCELRAQTKTANQRVQKLFRLPALT